MNPFESTLVTALRDEALETAMNTDLNEGRDILENRLDDVDRGRRRWMVVGGALAATAAVAAIAYLALGRPVASPEPADPTPSPSATASETFRSSKFAFPFTARAPQWVSEALDEPTSENLRHVTWNRCEGNICIGLTFLSLSVLDPFGLEERSDTAMPGYDAYLDYLDSLVASGKATISDRIDRTIDGRPAIVMTVMPLSEVPDGVGCEAGDGTTDDCWDFIEGVATRMAVVDVGSSNPLVILTRTPPDNVNGPAWTAQFDPMLDSVTLDLATVNPMVGVWQTSFSGEDVARVLAAAGLEGSTEQVLKEIGDSGQPLAWELWVDPTWYRLYSVASDGTRALVDVHTYVRDGGRVTGTTTDSPPLVTLSTVSVRGDEMTWTVDASTESSDQGAVPEEAMHRALYSTSTWARSTT